MPDIYLSNGGKQTIDTTSSMNDMLLQTNILVSPGTQAKITLADDKAFADFVQQLQNYGTVPHTTVTSPVTFTGTSHSPTPISIPSKSVPIVKAPVVTPPKGK